MPLIRQELNDPPEIIEEVVKAANATERFTGENVERHSLMMTETGLRTTDFGGEEFGLSGVRRSLLIYLSVLPLCSTSLFRQRTCPPDARKIPLSRMQPLAREAHKCAV